MAVVLAKDRDKFLVVGSDCDEELAIVLLHTRLIMMSNSATTFPRLRVDVAAGERCRR